MCDPDLEGALPDGWQHAARVLAFEPARQTERNSYEIDCKAAAKFAFSVRGRGVSRESTTVRPLHQAPPVQALYENGLTVKPFTESAPSRQRHLPNVQPERSLSADIPLVSMDRSS